MNVLAPVSNIMTKELKTLSPSDSLIHVKELFDKNTIHHIPVVEFKEIVGMISNTDYLSFRQGCIGSEKQKESYLLDQWKVADIMTDKLAKMNSDEPIRTAINVFALNRFHALPILENDELVGILTPQDIIRALDAETIPLADYKTVKQ